MFGGFSGSRAFAHMQRLCRTLKLIIGLPPLARLCNLERCGILDISPTRFELKVLLAKYLHLEVNAD
jgi:hypothetical protein